MTKPSTKFNAKLRDIHTALMAVHRESAGYSSSITGSEREAINRHLMSTILPANHRCGTGTIVDAYGNESGQVDGIIELPYSLSFPLATAGDGTGNRLYLADSVGAAFEYKSNLSAQADEALKKVEQIKALRRYRVPPNGIVGASFRVQTFIIAFAGGPKDRDALEEKFLHPRRSPSADAVLLLEAEIFIGRTSDGQHHYASGKEQCIFAFLVCLSSTLRALAAEGSSNLNDYVDAVKPDPMPKTAAASAAVRRGSS